MTSIKKLRLYWHLKRKRRKNNITHHGYSQYGQDLICLELLQDIESGTFIDIGTNDGVTSSLTPSLFEYLTTVGYKLYKCVGYGEIYHRN